MEKMCGYNHRVMKFQFWKGSPFWIFFMISKPNGHMAFSQGPWEYRKSFWQQSMD